MAESKVGVRPSTTTGSVDVIVDAHGSKVWPVYKAAYGDADSVTRVDEDNPLPVRKGEADVKREFMLQDSIDQLVIQMKILNAYMAEGFDETITEDDI